MKRLWIGLVALAVFTVAFAPSDVPALPEPGHRRILAAVFR